MSVNLSALTKAVRAQWNRTPDGRYLGLNKSGVLSGGGSGPASTPTLFADSFESQDLSASSASVNTINFQWTSANRTSILTQVDASTARRVYPTAFIQDYTDGRDVTAKNGSYSLGIEYAANVEMAEQRFAFDAQDEVWFRYWIRVPENFAHGTMNNKWFSIWQDAYDAVGTVTWQTRPDGSGGANLVYQDGGVISSEAGSTAFISSSDAGRWMQVVIHLVAESTNGSNDGVIELYRRWENESDFTQIHSFQSAVNQFSDGSGYRTGYILGYANDAYAEDTWWLVDDFEVSDQSLLYQQVTEPTSVPDLFSDSFESQDLSASAASVNNVNFQWTSGNRTSVLTQVDANTARRVYPTAFIQDYTDGRDVTAKTGSYSLGVEYAANVEMAEQRFAFDEQSGDIWLRFWIRVPENYTHGVGNGAPNNNKFFSLWHDGYIQAGTGSTIVWSMEDAGGGNTNLGFIHTLPGGGETSPLQNVAFITPADAGRWMQIVLHASVGTNAGSDSTIETYRRWENESSFTQLHTTNVANLTTGSANGWGGGYILGYANGPYAEDTWWLVDNFELSTGSLL